MSFDSPFSKRECKRVGQSNADAASSAPKFELCELELSLPDDLQLLAEQLSDDASLLSNLYPSAALQHWQATAQPEPAASTIEPRNRWAWLKPALVAASLLLAVSLAWQALPKNLPSNVIPVVPLQADLKPPLQPIAFDSTQTVATDVATKDSALAFQPVTPQPAEASRVIGTVRTEQAMVPAGLFLTLSGAEQEALLDLIEDANLQQPSVSF
jgi:hypothetical protein